jgi:hypothetical protein
VAGLSTLEDVNTYFASDAMVARLRRTAEEMRELGDTVRAEELQGRILAARQEAGRALQDRTDLYDGETIRLGKHRFAINSQPIDLTLTPFQGEMAVAITGTDFRERVADPEFAQTRHLWDRLLVSESPQVYRAEYLATSILTAAEEGAEGLTLDALNEAELHPENGSSLQSLVRGVAESRYDEGYERGVHDHDASSILSALLRLRAGGWLAATDPRKDGHAAAR